MDELIELEQRGWEALTGHGGAEFYDRLMSQDAVMVFASGSLDRAASIDAIRNADPWQEFHLESATVIRPAPNVGVVVYRATAKRAGAAEYRAWMSSTYVRQGDAGWRLVLHQQSPG